MNIIYDSLYNPGIGNPLSLYIAVYYCGKLYILTCVVDVRKKLGQVNDMQGTSAHLIEMTLKCCTKIKILTFSRYTSINIFYKHNAGGLGCI